MARRMRLAGAAVAAAALLMAGCGDDSGNGATTATTTAPTTAPTTTAASSATTGGASATTAPAPTGAEATITVGSTSLGDVLADGDGRTLYVFLKDTPDTSACTGGCLQVWPRYAPTAVSAGEGVDESLLGSITVDGATQATIDHKPLYYFASDAAPGDVNGQGISGSWYVVAADGTPVGKS